ncbi:hypothetical protein AAH994_14885 [Weeksellaceae bacterium A-14]
MELISKMFLGILGALFEVIILEIFGGIIKFFYRKIKYFFNLIIGKNYEEKQNPLIETERKYLYKNIILKEDLNEILKKGCNGAVLEIIDSENAFAEFYKLNSKKQIESNGELVFKVKLNQIELKK